VQELDGMIDGIAPPAPGFVPGPEITFVRVQVADGSIGEAPLFISGESEFEGISPPFRATPGRWLAQNGT
jgi:hypothetical protein